MPLRGKGRKSTEFLKGLTSTQVSYSHLAQSDIDVDLSVVVGTNTQLASSKAIKDYVDSVVTTDTVSELTDTTITDPQDNHHIQFDGTSSKWINAAYVDFDKISDPNPPGDEEARIFVKQIDSNNNALAVRIKKAGLTGNDMPIVELTSPGCVCECGSTDGAKDPIYNFAEGIMIVELYCGHSYEMDIPNLRRIK